MTPTRFPIWLTVFTIASLAILLSLGTWQMQRMAWKSTLIEQYEARGAVDSFQAAVCALGDSQFSPRVSGPAPLSGQELRLYALRGQPGWVRLGSLRVADCETGEQRFILIESAFETLEGERVSRPRVWRAEPAVTAGMFTPGNEADTNQWYSFDRIEMARALDIDPDQLLPVWIREDSGMPASLSQTPPSKHFGYALTWFGLALALMAVYAAMLFKRRQ